MSWANTVPVYRGYYIWRPVSKYSAASFVMRLSVLDISSGMGLCARRWFSLRARHVVCMCDPAHQNRTPQRPVNHWTAAIFSAASSACGSQRNGSTSRLLTNLEIKRTPVCHLGEVDHRFDLLSLHHLCAWAVWAGSLRTQKVGSGHTLQTRNAIQHSPPFNSVCTTCLDCV